jgi:outer membrane protein OmpA-like peptidoglycan-associated protein
MRSKLLTMILMGVLAGPAVADDATQTNKHEAAGVGGGVAVGAAVGGPVGAIVGAALGGWFGDRFHREKTARVELEGKYGEAQAEAQSLQARLLESEQRIKGSERQIAGLEREIETERQTYRAALQDALNTQIFFRTDESEIHEDSARNLQQLAKLVNTLDGFLIRLEGHADPRGEESYNEQLSAARAESVRDALVAAGFPGDRISVSAVGETQSRAEPEDLDAMAMERRVHIEVVGLDEVRRVAQQ